MEREEMRQERVRGRGRDGEREMKRRDGARESEGKMDRRGELFFFRPGWGGVSERKRE